MFRVVVVVLLILVNVFIFSFAEERHLSVSFLDVGQGDAILIQAPSGVQMLIDGGADKSVLRELGKQLSFFDRTIDAVIATHPDQDHIGGLPDVFERYRVGSYFESGVHHETKASSALEAAIENENIPRALARSGMRFFLGGGVYADVLFPDRDVANIESNAGSIIMRVVYGDNEFMLTGDSPSSIEGLLVSKYGEDLQSDVLKAGHHGSKTSSNLNFVRAVAPIYGIYSRGCDNRYGHPSPEVDELLIANGIQTFDTCEDGTVTFRSDGRTLSIDK